MAEGLSAVHAAPDAVQAARVAGPRARRRALPRAAAPAARCGAVGAARVLRSRRALGPPHRVHAA
jgi:hypothetical protein